MRVRSNPTVLFDEANCDDVNISVADDEVGVIQMEQGGERVWVPTKEAIAFADALKAFAEEELAA